MKLAQWTELPVSGPFDLAASAAFLEGFTPAARPDAAAHPGELRFAFLFRTMALDTTPRAPSASSLTTTHSDPTQDPRSLL